MEKSEVLKEQVKILEEYVEIYNTVKGSLMNESDLTDDEPDLSEIEFYADNIAKLYVH
ncbi:hypothetical protein ABE021_11955 [Sporosarcina gallistercoris]|uniref:hypothetical protein n=1 Tax=Sporosarcina gallistercoris TaxID=2762245 RepID=UPI003D2A3F99